MAADEDPEPGPLVRMFAVTGGRARPVGEAFDVIAVVTTIGMPYDPAGLSPEHLAALRVATRPTTVADIGTRLRLPLNITRVLLSDLRREGLVSIDPPAATAGVLNERIYQEVLNGLRAL
ncbi:DUF742 domain-containing protein [Herbidospora sp. NEAU-GS84]|uniref:DUF742 domain-containing protein n=1 Tax=Herbidospora solisilvae TaxID=2696284 RepID=A0A7C9NEL3_9ACTN|nr:MULTISPECIES: DUF742 domain-containing protein [Herbidospora]NAS22855.1 DUF742 domain-containing protein [Herbidospora solisilvae]GLX92551.1 hypothetical protein Hesp01_05010 [Herbidospora sp. NBRC 101105]